MLKSHDAKDKFVAQADSLPRCKDCASSRDILSRTADTVTGSNFSENLKQGSALLDHVQINHTNESGVKATSSGGNGIVAVNVGVILAMLLFLRRMSSAVEVLQLDQHELRSELRGTGRDSVPGDVIVYAIDGPFFFAAVESLERTLARTRGDPRCIIFRLGRVPFMDVTGIQALEEATRNLERRGVHVFLCEARPNVLRKLVRAGLAGKQVMPARYCRDLHEALAACDTRPAAHAR